MQLGIFFRFLQLDKLQAITLTHELKDASYEHCDESGAFTAKVPLIEENFDGINLFFIRQKIDISSCDVLIQSKQLNEIVEQSVPVSVNRFLKDIDCKLTLSCEPV